MIQYFYTPFVIIFMATMHAVRLPSSILDLAQKHSTITHRSVPKQIAYWATVGQALEENPDIPFSMMNNILLGLEEVKNGETTQYTFD